jgi:hypothetical protein
MDNWRSCHPNHSARFLLARVEGRSSNAELALRCCRDSTAAVSAAAGAVAVGAAAAAECACRTAVLAVKLLLLVLQRLYLARHKGRRIYLQLLWLLLLQSDLVRNKSWGLWFQLQLFWRLRLLLLQQLQLARHESWGIDFQLRMLLHCALCRFNSWGINLELLLLLLQHDLAWHKSWCMYFELDLPAAITAAAAAGTGLYLAVRQHCRHFLHCHLALLLAQRQ